MDEGVQILELARNAQPLFQSQEPREKRRLLNFVLSNCTWEDGKVATFRQPFELLAETTMIATRSAVDKSATLSGVIGGDQLLRLRPLARPPGNLPKPEGYREPGNRFHISPGKLRNGYLLLFHR